MSIEVVFYTQLASVFAFIVSLFVLYKLLVSAKDATIETLKQQISFLEVKNKDLAETSPDILLQRFESRTKLLEAELIEADKEKLPLSDEIEELKIRLAESNNSNFEEKQQLINQLVSVSQHAASLDTQRKQLELQLREVEGPYEQFLHYANAEVSPGRKQIVADVVKYLGIDFVISSSPQSLIESFSKVSSDVKKFKMHPKIHINGGEMTGLRSVGIISNSDQLTSVGVSVFKTIARDLKS